MKQSETTILLLDPQRVKPFADQPRKRFRGIAKLAESIRLVGQVTPIVVTPSSENGFDAELVDGERRLQACRLAALRIKATVAESVSAGDRFALSVAANFCRQGHDAMEIAAAIDTLRRQGRTLKEIETIFGKSSGFVRQHHSLLQLAPEVQRMLVRPDDALQTWAERRAAGKMTLSLALLLIPFDAATQVRAAQQIAARQMSLAAARDYIYRLGHKSQVKTGRTVSPAGRLQQFWSATEVYRCAVNRLADMPHAQLAALRQSWELKKRRALAAQLDDFLGALELVAGELRKPE